MSAFGILHRSVKCFRGRKTIHWESGKINISGPANIPLPGPNPMALGLFLNPEGAPATAPHTIGYRGCHFELVGNRYDWAVSLLLMLSVGAAGFFVATLAMAQHHPWFYGSLVKAERTMALCVCLQWFQALPFLQLRLKTANDAASTPKEANCVGRIWVSVIKKL